MANRPQGEGLEGLTAERLEELAALLCDMAAVGAEVSRMLDDAVGESSSALRMASESLAFNDAASLCRAVAGAERWMLVDPVDRTVSAGTRSPDRFEPFDAATGSLGLYPTLAAALASIHPEAGGTA